MHEIMVRGWVAVVLSSHIPCCTPTHWYIPLLARWASHDSLWPIRSLSLAYFFLTWFRGLLLCALHLFFGLVSSVSPLYHCSFVSFLGHSWFLLSYIVHLHFVCLWVLFLSFRFFSLPSSLVWWWHALVPMLQIRLVTPFVPPLGFDLGVLVWGDHLGLGFEVHLLDHAGMAVGLLCRLFRKKTKKPCARSMFVSLIFGFCIVCW